MIKDIMFGLFGYIGMCILITGSIRLLIRLVCDVIRFNRWLLDYVVNRREYEEWKKQKKGSTSE